MDAPRLNANLSPMTAADLKTVRNALSKFATSTAELESDLTASAAKEALATAENQAAALAIDDGRLTAEAFVDSQIEANRAVSIARLRLDRATADQADRRAQVAAALTEPSLAIQAALEDATPRVQAELVAALKSVLGDDYDQLRGLGESIGYSRGRRLTGAAERIRSATSPQDLAATIAHGINVLSIATHPIQ